MKNADKRMLELEKQLPEVFSDFIVIGLRRLEAHEERRIGELNEREYYAAHGNPLILGGLIQWALGKHVLKICPDGTVQMVDTRTKKLVKLPFRDVFEAGLTEPGDMEES
jgi:hypothetical protein